MYNLTPAKITKKKKIKFNIVFKIHNRQLYFLSEEIIKASEFVKCKEKALAQKVFSLYFK